MTTPAVSIVKTCNRTDCDIKAHKSRLLGLWAFAMQSRIMENRKDNQMVKYNAMSPADQAKAMKSIRTRGKTLRIDTHKLCVGFLLHYGEHGDKDKAMAIADLIGQVYTKSLRTAFIEWCVRFSNTLRWDKKTKTLVHDKTVPGGIKINPKCHVVTIFDMDRSDPKPFDFMKSMQTLIKRAESASKKGEITEAQLKALENFGRTIGIKVTNDGKVEIEATETKTEEPATELIRKEKEKN